MERIFEDGLFGHAVHIASVGETAQVNEVEKPTLGLVRALHSDDSDEVSASIRLPKPHRVVKEREGLVALMQQDFFHFLSLKCGDTDAILAYFSRRQGCRCDQVVDLVPAHLEDATRHGEA